MKPRNMDLIARRSRIVADAVSAGRPLHISAAFLEELLETARAEGDATLLGRPRLAWEGARGPAPRWAFERVEDLRADFFNFERSDTNVDVFRRDPMGWRYVHLLAAYIECVERPPAEDGVRAEAPAKAATDTVPLYRGSDVVGEVRQDVADRIVADGRPKWGVSGSFKRPAGQDRNVAHSLDLHAITAGDRLGDFWFEGPVVPFKVGDKVVGCVLESAVKSVAAGVPPGFSVSVGYRIAEEDPRKVVGEFGGLAVIEDPTLDENEFRIGPGAPRR